MTFVLRTRLCLENGPPVFPSLSERSRAGFILGALLMFDFCSEAIPFLRFAAPTISIPLVHRVSLLR